MSLSASPLLLRQLQEKANQINNEIQQLRSSRTGARRITAGDVRFYTPPDDPEQLIKFVEGLLITLDTERKKVSTLAGRGEVNPIDTKIAALLEKITDLNL